MALACVECPVPDNCSSVLNGSLYGGIDVETDAASTPGSAVIRSSTCS